MDPDSLDLALGPRLCWSPVPRPGRTTLTGRSVSLEPMNVDAHADALYHASHGDHADPLLWLYMGSGPFESLDHYRAAVRANSESIDPLFFAIVPRCEQPAGQAAYLRIDPANGVIEVGHIWFGASMQHSRSGTEAIYLLLAHVFDDLGYRRCEWKCHARNVRSRQAAQRFGFTYEGTFRNAVVMRDRSRDTAWYAITKEDWPLIRSAFEVWLADDNFGAKGRQRRSLSDIRSRS